MKISTMRFIDRFAGIPLCWISGIVRRFPHDRDVHPENVLAIKFFGLGSVLLTAPTLHLLKQRYPDVRIIYLSFSRNSEVIDQISFIDERWIISTDSAISFFTSFVTVVRRLMVRRIDVVLDFEFFSKFSTFIGALAHPGMQIGFSLPTRWRQWNLSHAVVLTNDRHVTRSFAAMLAPLGIHEEETPFPRLRPSSLTRTWRLPFRLRDWHSDIICLNPNAGDTSLDRRWDASRYAEALGDLLHEHSEALFCLIGSSHERGYVQNILNRVPHSAERIVNLAGETSLRDLIGLFSASRVLITNDSGPMHLAAAVGLPTIALFGPESPVFYGPLGNQTVNLYAHLPCSPCLNVYDAKVFRCPINAQCMKDVSVESVVKATRDLMRSTSQHSSEVNALR
jgi:ADP-heptose:LPS heptosyltransferase